MECALNYFYVGCNLYLYIKILRVLIYNDFSALGINKINLFFHVQQNISGLFYYYLFRDGLTQLNIYAFSASTFMVLFWGYFEQILILFGANI